jgi:Cdc6-like AAA superfamily ATPase
VRIVDFLAQFWGEALMEPATKNILLIGAPGRGKTTVIRRLIDRRDSDLRHVWG